MVQLHIYCRSIRIVAAEQFLLMVTFGNSHKPLQFSIMHLFTVLPGVVLEYSKHSHEYFQVSTGTVSIGNFFNDSFFNIHHDIFKLQLLCRLLNFAYMYNCNLPTAEKLLNDEIKWLKQTKV